jgi:hypothetical protein
MVRVFTHLQQKKVILPMGCRAWKVAANGASHVS